MLKSDSWPRIARTTSKLWALLAALALLPLAGFAAEVTLLPAPREAQWVGKTGPLERIGVRVPGKNAEDEFAAKDFEEAAKDAGLKVGNEGGSVYPVTLLRTETAEGRELLTQHKLTFDAAMQAEGYVLVLEPHQAFVVAASSSGVFYGIQTLKQLLPAKGEAAELPTGTVRDWPAMKYRGIDDDLSRGPFPTLDFIKHQIRVFAAYKINIYSPYIEHTLEYTDHPLSAPPGSSLSPEDVAELVRYAQAYHIMVIPEQEAFGHLHQILKYDLYKDVAETPNGHVLAPGQPGTLPLIKDWFTQIAAEFPAPFIHIGADETFDLGQGRTRPAVEKLGYGPVYVDFLTHIHDELAPLHRRLIFWGDIGGADPAAVAKLPKDMIAVPWNYWDTAGFDKMLEPFAKQGIETWVGPGDANWNQVFPIAETAFGNIQGFVRDGQKMGSTGSLTTVWNDDGEGLFNLDWYGVLFGAVAPWQPGESSISAYQAGYGRLFHGDTSGKIDAAEKELMAAHAALIKAKTGMTTDELFWVDPWSADGQTVSAKVLPNVVELRTHAEQAIELIAEARRENPSLKETDALEAMDLGARRLDFIGLKFELGRQIIDVYAEVRARQQDKEHRNEVRNQLDEISSMFGRCQDLRDGYSAIKDEYSHVWLSENRSYWLNNVTVRYDLRIELWQRRSDLFLDAIRLFDNDKPLPAPEVLEMPAAPVGQAH